MVRSTSTSRPVLRSRQGAQDPEQCVSAADYTRSATRIYSIYLLAASTAPTGTTPATATVAENRADAAAAIVENPAPKAGNTR